MNSAATLAARYLREAESRAAACTGVDFLASLLATTDHPPLVGDPARPVISPLGGLEVAS